MPTARNKNGTAVVTLTDSLTHKRRDFHCGKWDSPQSRQRVASIILQWEQSGRRWPLADVGEGIAIAEVVQRYWNWAEGYYSSGERWAIRSAWKVLVETHGLTAAEMFGPIKLKEVQQAMVGRGWNRNNINGQIGRVIAIFKWAAEHELLPITVYQALKTIRPLKRGRCDAPESVPVVPVAGSHVDAVKPWVSSQVWALITLQRLTGARQGELLKLRKCDIDQSEDIWRLTLDEHKTAHHGKSRTIYFGARAKLALSPWLDRPDDAYLFSPRDAEEKRIEQASAARVTPIGQGNRPRGRRRKDLGDHYTSDSYRRAITRACDQANRWARGGCICADDARIIPRWHPHQIRHTAATEIRKQFGLEAAQVMLGHSSAQITDAIYAERDHSKVVEIMRQVG